MNPEPSIPVPAVGATDDLQARCERLKELAVRSGVKLVSEEELRQRFAVKCAPAKRERRAARQECRTARAEIRNLKPEGERPPPRLPYRDADFEPQMDTDETQIPPTRPLTQGIELPDKAVRAVDFESSANALLLAFFRVPKNFNRWFAAKWLEDEVAQGKSGRMNNRAIWLRAQFNVAGLELDQHPCPPGENLPNGSYYRLCRIEDALRLSAGEKHRLTHPEAELI